jgi:SAM-dependent methyltransferase
LKESAATASREEVEAFLDSTDFTGYQAVPLPHGLSLPGLERRDRIEQALNVPLEGRSYMDVGTYYGIFPYEATQRGATRAVGLEPDPDRCRIAQRIAELHGDRWEVRPQMVEELEPDERFDVVTFTNVLHHVQDPIDAVRRLVNVCNETLVIEFCLPDDPEYLVQLYSSGASSRLSWWRARARSLTIRLVTGKLPLMAVGNWAIHRTFYFTPKAFENLFCVHHRFFDSIRFEPSATGQRRVMAFCSIAPEHRD